MHSPLLSCAIIPTVMRGVCAQQEAIMPGSSSVVGICHVHRHALRQIQPKVERTACNSSYPSPCRASALHNYTSTSKNSPGKLVAPEHSPTVKLSATGRLESFFRARSWRGGDVSLQHKKVSHFRTFLLSILKLSAPSSSVSWNQAAIKLVPQRNGHDFREKSLVQAEGIPQNPSN